MPSVPRTTIVNSHDTFARKLTAREKKNSTTWKWKRGIGCIRFGLTPLRTSRRRIVTSIGPKKHGTLRRPTIKWQSSKTNLQKVSCTRSDLQPSGPAEVCRSARISVAVWDRSHGTADNDCHVSAEGRLAVTISIHHESEDCFRARSARVFFVAELFHLIDNFPVEVFLNGKFHFPTMRVEFGNSRKVHC